MKIGNREFDVKKQNIHYGYLKCHTGFFLRWREME